jgi:membrane protease YdiL (CAAX protease family)
LAVVFAVFFPGLAAWLYFVTLAGSGQTSFAQQLTYSLSKIIQFGFPVAFVALVERRWPRPNAPWTAGLGLGLASGLLIAGGLLGLYFTWLSSTPLLQATPGMVLGKLRELGVASTPGFVGLALFVSVCHSLLEEYYWRWFVHGRLRQLLPALPATLLSGLGFMAHHVIILAIYLPGWFWAGVVPLSLAIAVGGWLWAWLYERTGNLLGPWLSHALVDAAIFVVGWDLYCRALR